MSSSILLYFIIQIFQGKEIKGLKIIKIVDKLAKHDPIRPINIDPVLKYECYFKEQFDTYPEPIKPSAIIIKGNQIIIVMKIML